ncbi:Uncharacterized protein TCM_044217 [Theobroma cacao]|uniref:Uncharacterized protein n=1 Tax=Theobroma cacao TaxID=3641 RepID=A0A061FPM2_THECC|nr:Uncharacterized protein TCM_044217 [Theobroma cacao]
MCGVGVHTAVMVVCGVEVHMTVMVMCGVGVHMNITTMCSVGVHMTFVEVGGYMHRTMLTILEITIRKDMREINEAIGGTLHG